MAWPISDDNGFQCARGLVWGIYKIFIIVARWHSESGSDHWCPELFDIQLCPHIDRHSWMAWGQGMLAGLSSHIELLAHSSYISYVGKTNILTSKDVLGLFANVCFSTSQPCLQHEYTTWMFMHLILFIWYLKGLPNFNIVFINISFQLSCNFTPFLGIYQEILLSCMILTYLCKIHNGLDFFVGSPVVTRPDNDNYTFHNVKFILWYIQLSFLSRYL